MGRSESDVLKLNEAKSVSPVGGATRFWVNSLPEAQMSEDLKSNQRRGGEPQRVSLSTPWGPRQSISRSYRCDLKTDADIDEIKEFIGQRTRLHEAYIREEAKSRRLGLVLAFLLILAAALVVQFAPVGRENLSYWIGAALVIFAAGSCGFGRIWGKALGISFGADRGQHALDRKDKEASEEKS